MVRSRGFRDLLVWQKATDLVVDVYDLTRSFPSDERFGLTSQTRRAAVSVPANVAEGSGRATRGEFANCLSVARGSLQELENMFEIGMRLDFIPQSRADTLFRSADEIGRMLSGLRRGIARRR